MNLVKQVTPPDGIALWMTVSSLSQRWLAPTMIRHRHHRQQ